MRLNMKEMINVIILNSILVSVIVFFYKFICLHISGAVSPALPVPHPIPFLFLLPIHY